MNKVLFLLSGLFVHQQTRSKVLVEALSALNLSINYKKVMTIKHDIAETVKTHINQNNNVYFRKKLSPEQFLYFAVDKKNEISQPTRKNTKYQSYLSSLSSTTVELYRDDDTAWSILKSLSGAFAKNIPTWAAYNSLLSDSKSVTNICTLPLISGSPTNWSNLRSALKVTEDMLNFVTENQKAIVSLDLQLYSKCIQLYRNKMK